ncbi:MAG TPA: TIM barrel protein [Gryllotalpicola sp.]
MSIRFANAPVSWGIWGANSLPPGRTPADVLRAIDGAGYDGVELGPLGFFGRAGTIAATLAEHGLACAGMYVPLRVFEGDEVLEADQAAVADVCRVVAAAGGDGPVILAEETIDAIKANVARGRGPSPLDLDDAGWARLSEAVERARRTVEEAGLRASFHPHTGTHVEQPWETDRLLEQTGVGLTLDTGHAAAGGDDPVELLRRWSGRIDHIHMKDIRSAAVADARSAGRIFGMADASAPLGAGDLDLPAFLAELGRQAYSGWVVVEQDRRPDGGHDHTEVDREQHRNLTWLRDRIGTVLDA